MHGHHFVNLEVNEMLAEVLEIPVNSNIITESDNCASQ